MSEPGGPWHRGTSVQTAGTTKVPLRLPSLVVPVQRPRRRSSSPRLSLGEPSPLSPGDHFLSDGLSCHGSVSQKQLPPSRPSQLPAYIHFTRSIQPVPRPRPVRRHSHNTDTLPADLGPLAPRRRSSQDDELSVVGKPCVLSCGQRQAVAPPRPQLHVFLPSEAEEADGESVDEGFMEELDAKINSLKLKAGAPQRTAEMRDANAGRRGQRDPIQDF